MDQKAQSQSNQCNSGVAQIATEKLINPNPNLFNPLFLKREFYLLFTNATCWWKCFLKKGFGHIDILWHDDFNWIYLNISQSTMLITILPALATTPVEKILKDFNSIFKNPTVIKIVTKFVIPSKQLIFPKMGVTTCTQLIKYLIGIKMFTWTPYHFYKKLLRIAPPMNQILLVKKIGE